MHIESSPQPLNTAPYNNPYSINRQQKIGAFFTGIWLLYILLAPLYVFPKGMPQPADYIVLMAGFPAILFAFIQFKGRIKYAIVFGLLFAALTMTVNLVHYFHLPNDRFLKHSIYYVFNFSMFVFTLLVFRQSPYQMNKIAYYAVAITVLFQACYAPFFGDIDVFRNTGSFNNANQLAYWCVLSMAILVILKRGQRFTLLDFVLFGALVFLQTLSLSKAGIIITTCMLLLIFCLQNMPRIARICAFFGVLIVFLTQVLDPDQLEKNLNKFQAFTAVTERLQNIGAEQDDSLSGRGYDRLIRHPHYMIFGAGEGAFYRFGIGTQELHSGLATILFCYGITGSLVFLCFVALVFYKQPWYFSALLFLVFLFGIPHQNIRFTYFWIFLAIAYSHRLYFQPDQMVQYQQETTIEMQR